jgi:serine/threonine-protein kinase
MSPFLATPQFSDAGALRADFAGPANSKAAHPVAAHTVQFDAAASDPLQLGAWQLESLIAEGQRTLIYRARPMAGEGRIPFPGQYAVKVLREDWQNHEGAVAQIRQEAHIGRCVSHRHLTPVLSVHVHRPPFYIVLPWLNGRTVATHLAARGRIEIPLALWIARQAAQALDALHTAGYAHGDVNPKNLLLAPDGHVSLIDLSCSRLADGNWEQAEPTLADYPILGTPNYLPPEIFTGKPSDPSSDLYSLGLTLFQMLAGRLPTMPDDLAALAAFKREGQLPSVRSYAPQVPPNVAKIVQDLTARDPLRRLHPAREVVHHFMRLEIATLGQRVLV